MPPMAPSQKKIQASDVVQALRKNPMLTSAPPFTETQNGPFLSWSRPAKTKLIANTKMRIVKIMAVSARFQPKSFSSGATNTLHAYAEPRARFMESPPTTRHHRLMEPSALISISPRSLGRSQTFGSDTPRTRSQRLIILIHRLPEVVPNHLPYARKGLLPCGEGSLHRN